jgi:hypothetical protein
MKAHLLAEHAEECQYFFRKFFTTDCTNKTDVACPRIDANAFFEPQIELINLDASNDEKISEIRTSALSVVVCFFEPRIAPIKRIAFAHRTHENHEKKKIPYL